MLTCDVTNESILKLLAFRASGWKPPTCDVTHRLVFSKCLTDLAPPHGSIQPFKKNIKIKNPVVVVVVCPHSPGTTAGSVARTATVTSSGSNTSPRRSTKTRFLTLRTTRMAGSTVSPREPSGSVNGELRCVRATRSRIS